MIKKTFLLLFFFLTIQLSAWANFDYNANCVEAYKAIFCLKLNEAKSLIQKEKQQNPKNGITILLDNYIDYFNLLASESKLDYNKLKDNRSTRIFELEKNEKNSPYYLFSQAEVYLQWGLLKGKFGDYFSSSIDLKKADNLLKENAKRYPDFILNKKSLALINVVFGAIPPNLKSITRFLGMSGNVQDGIKQLDQLRTELPKTKYSYYKSEVIFFLCNIDIDILNNRNNYSKLISYLTGMENNSLLKSYLQGYIALKTNHNDEAIAFLNDCPKSNQYIYLPVVNYLLGNAKLNKLDPDAPALLLKYVEDYKGTNYVKDSYLKIAYYYLLTNDFNRYDYYIKLVRNRGSIIDEKDQQALREANNDRPDTGLLRARFYFDGGYYNKALNQLKNREVSNFKLLKDKIEFYYRLGRIYEKTDKLNEAQLNYQRTINIGKATKYYYAANAALRIGNIYEQKKDIDKAADYYNQAINMKDHEYENSIQNEANQGLKRINR